MKLNDNTPITLESDTDQSSYLQSFVVSAAALPLLCRFGWHRFSKWSDCIIERFSDGKCLLRENRYQVQMCMRCQRRNDRVLAGGFVKQ